MKENKYMEVLHEKKNKITEGTPWKKIKYMKVLHERKSKYLKVLKEKISTWKYSMSSWEPTPKAEQERRFQQCFFPLTEKVNLIF